PRRSSARSGASACPPTSESRGPPRKTRPRSPSTTRASRCRKWRAATCARRAPSACGWRSSGRSNLRLLELERRGVHAVAQARGLGAVVEDVPEVRVATRAQHLGALREPAVVLLLRDVLLRHRLEEARPAGAGVELGLGAEERQAAAGALVHARVLGGVVLAGEGALGAVLAHDLVLLLGELGLPLGVGLDDLFHGTLQNFVIPAQAGIQTHFSRLRWRHLAPARIPLMAK